MARNLTSVSTAALGSSTFSRRLNMEVSEMVIDEQSMSFYDDDDDALTQHCSFSSSATKSRSSPSPHMGLLSDEGSPRRFQIFERTNLPAVAAGADHQKLQTAVTPPAKTLRMFHSLSLDLGSMECSMDDEYMSDLYDLEAFEQPSTPNRNYPRDMDTLFSGEIKTIAPENLFAVLTPKRSHAGFKRSEPPSSNSRSPKRFCSEPFDDKENLDSSYTAIIASPKHSGGPTAPGGRSFALLRKSMSLNDDAIMSALTRSESQDLPDLIGDFSKPYALPLLEGRHRDLKSISSETLARLLRGDFAAQVDSYKIIDCRYPYEYEGGHIRGAKNLYMQPQIVEEFLTQTRNLLPPPTTRSIVIFHCEFSSERGPKLSRFLRNNDRARNTSAYPALDYPELYLLHNGYKEFFETHAELCVPRTYCPMLEPAFNEEYRLFRAKTKSWNGDSASGGGGATTSRLKKSRSRLML